MVQSTDISVDSVSRGGHLNSKKQRTLATQELTGKWNAWDGRVQHDVHELVRLLIDALER